MKMQVKKPIYNVLGKFLGLIPKAQTRKEKINKWDYIKLKSFYRAKETIDKMKR